jgi:di/tricarboxylate transporter
MSLAWISVGALLVAVVLSCTTTINIGVLSLALALIVGVFFGGMAPDIVLEGFPTGLLTTLVSVTLLFSIADCNGTLARLTDRAVALCRGHAGMLPIMFFLVGFLIATIGAGATPASALLAPPAMAAAARAGVRPFQMAIMAGNGVLAGTLSPFAPTGIVAHGVMANIGLGGVEWYTFAFNAFAHALVGIAGFLMFGGWRLFRRHRSSAGEFAGIEPGHLADSGPMEWRHWLTACGIGLLIVAVVGFSLDVGMIALIVAAALILCKTVDEGLAIRQMPWSVILMVTGVSVLVAMVRETEGLALITRGIAAISTPATIEAIVAFGAGFVSVYSSTSGVVLPAFLPMVPPLAEQLGGIDQLSIAWSMAVSASLVDLSSLSTVGALFMASAAAGTDVRRLFNALLAWGLTMSVVGAVLCWAMFG